MPAEELVQRGLCDPIRVFVKNEPHSNAKAAEGRWRLIMSVSLVDQLVERLLSSEQNGKEIANHHRLPVKPGMGFSPELIASTGAYLDGFDQLVSSDVSGWDWSVTGDELRFDAMRRLALSGESADSAYGRALLARSVCLSRSVIAFSDGELVAQRFDGVQKSGSYNTSSGNSWIRVAAARFSGASCVCAMGDDCVDDGCDLERMARVGHPIKESAVVDSEHPSWLEEVALWPEELEDDVRSLLDSYSWEPYERSLVPVADFCSHFWLRGQDGTVSAIAYRGWRKSLLRLVAQKTHKEHHFAEFVGLMAHSPAMPHCVRTLLDGGWFEDNQLS